MNAENTLLKNYKKAIFVLEKACEDVELRRSFNAASQLVLNCYRNGGRLYIGGNGGSAADAQHLAAEFVSKLAKDRAPLAAEALTVDSSVLTAIGNDYGFEHLFARQL